jgi:hypothetical protein
MGVMMSEIKKEEIKIEVKENLIDFDLLIKFNYDFLSEIDEKELILVIIKKLKEIDLRKLSDNEVIMLEVVKKLVDDINKYKN